MRHHDSEDRELLVALRRLADSVVVPPADPCREAALLDAFEHDRQQPRASRAAYWWMTAVASAAALLIAFGIAPVRDARHQRDSAPPGTRTGATATDVGGAPRQLPGEFVPWPGSGDLPPLESGELVRIDLPVSMLPSLGMVPPPSHGAAVRADVVVGQDGLARAVRLVAD